MATAEKHRRRSRYSYRKGIPSGIYRYHAPVKGIRIGDGLLGRIMRMLRRAVKKGGDHGNNDHRGTSGDIA